MVSVLKCGGADLTTLGRNEFFSLHPGEDPCAFSNAMPVEAERAISAQSPGRLIGAVAHIAGVVVIT
jgi:hypothetical protein